MLRQRQKTQRRENKKVFLEGKVRVKPGHPVSERLKAATVRNELGMPLGTESRISLRFVLFCPWQLKSTWHKKGNEAGA